MPKLFSKSLKIIEYYKMSTEDLKVYYSCESSNKYNKIQT